MKLLSFTLGRIGVTPANKRRPEDPEIKRDI
jgi:hypothetical protein